ncbi:MAG: NAD(P)/FAD-dependent oxidoreductase [Candidatus Latescibacteria bacterium]|nr:NAD(P)/FAD-dependent oxidoreductase [Candidatus Latescibacterota bacterium]
MGRTGRIILVLGAGVGGLVAANELRKRLPRMHRILLVEREADFVFAPSLLWVMTGDRTIRTVSRPIARLERKGIEVIRGQVESIDSERRAVVAAGRRLTPDYLIIALGADLAPEGVPGLKEAGHDFYAPAGADSFREAFASFAGGKLVLLTASPAYKCPGAPYEAAMLLEAACRKRGIRAQAEISLYAAEAGPMGVAGPDVSRRVRQMVESKGVRYYPEHQVTEVLKDPRRIRFASGGDASYDLLAYVPPLAAPRVVRDAGLLGESGWVPVDRNTLQTKYPGVFALGDVTGIPLAMGKPLPKAGVFAHKEAEVVARNVAREITGRGARASYDGWGECFIETGDGRGGFGRGDFYAEPTPRVSIERPSWRWHAAKVLFEKYWLRRWF